MKALTGELSDIPSDDDWPHAKEKGGISKNSLSEEAESFDSTVNQTSSYENRGGRRINGSDLLSPSPLHSLHLIPIILD